MTRFWGQKHLKGEFRGSPTVMCWWQPLRLCSRLGSVTSCWTDPDLAVCWWEYVELLCMLCPADQHSTMAAPRLICVTFCVSQCPEWHPPSEIQQNTADERYGCRFVLSVCISFSFLVRLLLSNRPQMGIVPTYLRQ